MKKSIIKTTKALFVFAVIAITLSSCNRGMGCPGNFSLENQAIECIQIIDLDLLKQ
ncbi:MAG: hypothetical protein ACPG5P_08880 [Saprospiraceae bacterium]